MMIGALLSGFLTAIAFPTVIGSTLLPRVAPLAWVSLVPLILSLRDATPKKVFQRGFVFGTVFYTVSLYWVFTAMHDYGDVPVWGGLIGLFCLVGILSLLMAAAFSFASWVTPPLIPFGGVFLLAWVGQDFLRNSFPFGGFSWSSLGYSQAPFQTLIQVADLTGVYGVTAFIVLSNVVCGELILVVRAVRAVRATRLATRPVIQKKSFPIGWVGAFVVVMAAVLSYGYWRIREIDSYFQSLPVRRVAVVQANIPQDEKWLTERVDEIIARHLALTEEAGGIDLAIWPEAAYPVVVPPDVLKINQFEEITSPILTGAVTYEGVIPEEWPPRPDEKNFTLYNSALLIEPGGFIAGEYHKNHLVPMGEYVPGGRFLYFLSKIVPAISSFTPGRGLNLLTANGMNMGVTICFEDLFPEISRALARQGANLLINLTNDAWYGHYSALYHHFDFSRFRAIENRRTLVRATNTGVTGIFDATGRATATAPLFSETVLTPEIRLGGPISFYSRWGDLFAWGCVVALGLLGVRRCFQR